RVDHAPFRLFGEAQEGRLVTLLQSLVREPVEADIRAVLGGAERRDAIAGRGGEIALVPFTAPAWARAAVVDLTMDRAQWTRFTDFGVSVIDAAGRIVAKQPLNYAVGRLQVPLPEQHGDLALRLHLLPGLAEPGSTEPWRVTATIRLYADSGVALDAGVERTHRMHLASGETLAAAFERPPSPWPLPERFHPLAIVIAAARGEAWTREIGLGPEGTP
ncbi:MAG TPA: hypothetical protein VFU46_10080, partial [Gemmatimonadales bacterium]|nr:hypothetical protein [Gemmatimonadales bacterium]